MVRSLLLGCFLAALCAGSAAADDPGLGDGSESDSDDGLTEGEPDANANSNGIGNGNGNGNNPNCSDDDDDDDDDSAAGSYDASCEGSGISFSLLPMLLIPLRRRPGVDRGDPAD